MKNRFNSRSQNTNILSCEKGVYENEIPGLPVTVKTFGQPLTWQRLTVPKDTTIIEDKRDRFEKRNDLINKIAEAGVFEYALAYAPKSQAMQASTRRSYSVKCSFCGAGHNWVVFYRRADDAQKYLGYSGVSCFAEVVNNLKIEAAEAVIKAAKKEEHRCKKFVETMEKINDFKNDFPGLYENREVLSSAKNPYARLWLEVLQQLNRAEGIDEKYLADCDAGVYDRKGRYRGYVDRSARRIPKFLQVTSASMREAGIEETLKMLQEKATQEEAGSPFRKVVSQPYQRPADNPNLKTPTKEQMEKAAILSQKIGYNYIVNRVIRGEQVSEGCLNWLETQLQGV